MLAVSLSWILLFAVTPAADRPYVDGSTGNSAVAMVFGYNGLERFGISFPGAVDSGPGISAGSGAPGYGGPGNPLGLPAGVFKLLSGWYGPQAGWLYPLAVLGLVAGLYLTRWAPRGNPVRCGFLMWGTWLGTAGLVFSVMTTLPHTAYLAMLAPPAAALAAAGICTLVHVYRAGRPSGWLLPAAVLTEVLWAWFLWRDYRGFLPWALTAALAAGLVAAVVLGAARLAPAFPHRVADAALALGVAAMLAAPATWTASVLDLSYAGTSFDASPARPTGTACSPCSRGPSSAGCSARRRRSPGKRRRSTITSTPTATARPTCSPSPPGRKPPGSSWRPARRPCRSAGSAARYGPRRWPGRRTWSHRAAAVLLDRLVRRARHRRRGPEIGHGWPDRLLGTQHLHPGPRRRLRRPARRLRRRKRRGGAL